MVIITYDRSFLSKRMDVDETIYEGSFPRSHFSWMRCSGVSDDELVKTRIYKYSFKNRRVRRSQQGENGDGRATRLCARLCRGNMNSA